MRVGDEREPLLARHVDRRHLAGGRVAGFAALTVDERAGIARVVQGAQHPPVPQRFPGQLTPVRALADADREPQPGGVELGDHGAGRAGAGEHREQVRDRLTHAEVGVEHDLVAGVVDQPDRQAHLQLAAARLGQLPAAQPGPDEVQLGLGHGALEPQQQAVVELARVIESVLVADQRAGQRADLQQPVPVGVVAGQPGDFQAEHDPGPPHPDLGDQMLEPFPVGGRGAGLALIHVDGDHLVGLPAQRDRLLPQRVLPSGGLGVGEHLAQCGLPDIQVSRPGQVPGGDLARGLDTHRDSPACGGDGQRHRGQRVDEPVGDTTRRNSRSWLAGWRARRGRDGLPGPQPGHHAAVLQHAQPAPPARGVAGQRAGAQLFVTGDIVMISAARGRVVVFIGSLRFWASSPVPAPVPPSADAPTPRTAARSARPARVSAARGRPRAPPGRTRRCLR